MSVPSPGELGRKPPFDELVTEYEKKIFNVILRIISDYDEAADLTQETFISAYKGYANFRGEAQVYTWLYQIALNHCRNRLRKRRRMQTIHVESLDQPKDWESEDDTRSREVADMTHEPGAILQEKEFREKILAAMKSLPIDYREVIVLREIEQKSYNEIAEIAGISLDNVKTRISRARGMLRRKLAPYYQMD